MGWKLARIIGLVLILFCGPPASTAGSDDRSPVTLSDSLGAEIDSAEAERYHLFPDIRGFKSGRLFRVSPSKYHFEYEYRKNRWTKRKTRTVSSEAVELTRLHLQLAEEYEAIRRQPVAEGHPRADVTYELALRYASQARYDIASLLMQDLLSLHPHSPPAAKAREKRPQLDKLSRTGRALFVRGSLIDRSGRTDLIVFAGYYGLWLGIATPIALEAETAQAYAVGLLLGGPVAVGVALEWTSETNITDGTATMISLGAHLGTWQGIGWAAIADRKGHTVIGIGEVAGIAGIASAVALASSVDFSPGHASLTSSGLPWGAWLGLVIGAINDVEDDDLLRMCLLGSDIAVVATAVAARNTEASRSRVRLINLAGVIGTVFGFGLDLLGEVDETPAIFAIAGTGSVCGLALGAVLTRDYDRDRELVVRFGPGVVRNAGIGHKSPEWSLSPTVLMGSNPDRPEEAVPCLGVRLEF